MQNIICSIYFCFGIYGIKNNGKVGKSGKRHPAGQGAKKEWTPLLSPRTWVSAGFEYSRFEVRVTEGRICEEGGDGRGEKWADFLFRVYITDLGNFCTISFWSPQFFWCIALLRKATVGTIRTLPNIVLNSQLKPQSYISSCCRVQEWSVERMLQQVIVSWNGVFLVPLPLCCYFNKKFYE